MSEKERTDGLPLKRRRTFIDIAVKRAKAMAYSIPEKGFGSATLLKLEGDDLIRRDSVKGSISPAHDVLEDWALDAFVDDACESNGGGNIPSFLNTVGAEPAMNRAFRLWLQRKLKENATRDDATKLILGILHDPTIQPHWKDEAISASLTGQDSYAFLDTLRSELLEGEAELLKRFCFILRISCKIPDHNLIRQMAGREGKQGDTLGALFLKPRGDRWEAIIRFLFESKSRITEALLPHCVAVLDEWGAQVNLERELPQPAREAGLLTLHLLEMVKDDYRDNADRKKLVGLIMKLVPVIDGECTGSAKWDTFGLPG